MTDGLPAPAYQIDPINGSPAQQDEAGVLSYRQLIWRRFRKNRMGMVAGALLIVCYTIAVGAPFVAPYHYNDVDVLVRHVPPQSLHLSIEHGFYVYGIQTIRNVETLEMEFAIDTKTIFPVSFLFMDNNGNRHLLGSEGPFFLLGTDRMGRDLLSRIIFGARVSMSIGLVGVFLSLILGSLLGTVSGYFGGWMDHLIQRIVELLASFPPIPLWMALGAAVPAGWTSIETYLGITIILSIVSWGGLAREIRGKVLVYREQEFALAALAAGASHWYIITRHLLPGCYSHIIVIATLAIPGMILGETALSFLGLGIRPPMTSWGVLLEEAQRVTVLLHYPWLLYPAVPVLLVVIAFNFLGDALRDAADPYAN
ncbi:MAG: ABC transporter permease [Candidatus Latescibacteria bacterium]|nr:ABC transporter permease [Candidatus Latescibacterota bacterium]